MPKIVKKRGRRGFGGPWRAYVRAKTLGRRNAPSLKQLGHLYRQDKASGVVDMTPFEVVGAAATRAGRLYTPAAGRSIFGATSRDEQRRHSREISRALLAVGDTKDKAEAAITLAERCSGLGTNVAQSLKAARAALRLHTKASSTRAKDDAGALQAYRDGAGAEGLATLRQAFPSLPLEAGITPVPTDDGLCFEVQPATQAMISDSIAWAYQTKQCNASSTLRQFWEELHQVTEGESSSQPPGANGPKECRAAGQCVCQGPGCALRRFRNAFLRALKAAFPTQSLGRKHLVDGFVFVRLTGRPSDDNADAFVELDEPIKETWLHVGLQYLSPFRPTFMEVHVVEGPASGDLAQDQFWVQAIPGVPTRVNNLGPHNPLLREPPFRKSDTGDKLSRTRDIHRIRRLTRIMGVSTESHTLAECALVPHARPPTASSWSTRASRKRTAPTPSTSGGTA